MTDEQNKVTPQDEPPKSGEWVDQEEFFKELTSEERAEGEHLGAETDDVDFIEDEDGNEILIPLDGGDEDESGDSTE